MITYGSNAWAQIDLITLEQNYKIIEKYAGNSQIIAVVKADAYGHGVEECSRVFYNCGCRFFAVATPDEALRLRALYDDCEILILGVCPYDSANILSENDIIVALGSYSHAKGLSDHLYSGRRLRAHLKLDTGMNRIGFSSREEDFAEILSAFDTDNLEIEGMFSHFACADMPDSDMTENQFRRFCEVDRRLKENGINLKARHISNSAATVFNPETHFEYVRCGIILYGLSPSGQTRVDELKPVMTLKTRVTHIHIARTGEKIGYGATYTCEKDMKIATLPIGYADGFIRAYGNGGYVLIGGNKAPIVGRICMDQCMVDVTGLDVEPGDKVEIFGAEHTVDDFAECANTINYECTCLLSKRVDRKYIRKKREQK